MPKTRKKRLFEQPLETVVQPSVQPSEKLSDKKQQVIRLYEEGKSLGQIAEKTRLPKGTVSRIIRRYGLVDLDPLAVRDEIMRIKNDISTIAQKVESLANTLRNLQNPQPMEQIVPAKVVPKAVRDDAQRDENPFLKALDMFEQGLGPLEVMRSLDMDVETVKNVLADWKALREAYEGAAPKDVVIPDVAKTMGENLRDTCDHFNPQSGVCMVWHVTEIDDSLRRNAPGIVKAVGGKARWNVSLHPEVCALCALERLQRRVKA